MARAIYHSCGVKESPHVSRDGKLLVLQGLLFPPLVLQFPNKCLYGCLRFSMSYSFNLELNIVLPGNKNWPLDADELLALSVILVKPVLMSPLFVTEDAFTGVHDGSGKCAPMFLNILWVLFGQNCPESTLQLLLVDDVLQQHGVKLWPALSLLQLPFPH